MKKLLILGFAIVFVIGLLVGLAFMNGSLIGKVIGLDKTAGNYSYTKALCYEKQCMDVFIECYAGNVVSIKPVSEVVQFGENWTDLRNQTAVLCH